MNKTTKGVIIGSAILIGAILFFSYFQTKQQLYPGSGTLYNSWDVDLNTKQLTYSDTSTEDLRANAFKSEHGLTGSLGNDFSSGGLNKRFWRFFLIANDVNPDNFRDYSGMVSSGVFSPINFEDLVTANYDESQRAWVYRSSVPVGEDINKIKDLGFSWDYRGTWKGGYKTSVMQDMANKMACYVEGQTTVLADGIYLKSDRSEKFIQSYKIYGETQYTQGSFICKVNTDELFNELPKTFTRSDGATVNVGGAGIDGKVVFYFGERSYNKYRLTNNQCNLIEIKESEITSNDYSSLEICNSKIEDETPEDPEDPEEVECTDNIDCISICGDEIPTCENNACFCSGEQVFEEEQTPYYLYLIPVVIFGLVALIVWMKMKKPRRRKR